MIQWLKRIGNYSLLIVPAGLGILFFLMMKTCAKGPVSSPVDEHTAVVRIIEAAAVDLVPKAVGYGSAEPEFLWQAIADVQGDVIWAHPRLESGEIIFEPTTLLRIDPTEYKLAARQLEAQIKQDEAQIDELQTSVDNTQALLAIEKDVLQLSEKELKRKEALYKQKNVSASDFEREQRSLSAQRLKVRQYENAIDLFPDQKASLEAQLDVTRARLEQAKNDVLDTEITLPFAARIFQAPVELNEYVSVGTLLVEAYGIAKTEVTAEISINEFRRLLSGKPIDMEAAMRENQFAEVFRQIGLSARVVLDVGGEPLIWDAGVARVRGVIDPTTRTLGVVVSVEEPYRQFVPGERPPLVPGMFCQVEVTGAPLPDALIIPRNAYHNGMVYVMEENGRLSRRTVAVKFFQDDLAVLSTGVEPGEKIVVSDLSPAIEGMLLESEHDEALQRAMIAKAAGIAAGMN